MRTPEERRAEAVRGSSKFVFFWKEAELDPGCLSQFWPAAFTVDGVGYPTAEHWMMSSKARLFADEEAVEVILRSPSPEAAKAAGRRVRGFSEAEWAAARYEIVVAGNLAKFTQNDDLGRFLASTGDMVLVEASPLDRVWGIGLDASDERAASPARWRGSNLLGFALMEVRERL